MAMCGSGALMRNSLENRKLIAQGEEDLWHFSQCRGDFLPEKDELRLSSVVPAVYNLFPIELLHDMQLEILKNE